jgi:hypothetical protein
MLSLRNDRYNFFSKRLDRRRDENDSGKVLGQEKIPDFKRTSNINMQAGVKLKKPSHDIGDLIDCSPLIFLNANTFEGICDFRGNTFKGNRIGLV